MTKVTGRASATLRWHLVSRHPGALAWLHRHARPGPVFVHTHLDRLEFDAGDIVCGVLPVHLMARINQLGARVAVIEMDVPADLRGRELSPEELDAVGARLVEYRATRLTELGQDDAVSIVHPAAPLPNHHDARDPPGDRASPI